MINTESNFWVDLGETYQQAVSASLPRGARFQILMRMVRPRMYKPAILALWASAHQWRILKIRKIIDAANPPQDMKACLTVLADALDEAVRNRRLLNAHYRRALAILDELRVGSEADLERLYPEISQRPSHSRGS